MIIPLRARLAAAAALPLVAAACSSSTSGSAADLLGSSAAGRSVSAPTSAPNTGATSSPASSAPGSSASSANGGSVPAGAAAAAVGVAKAVFVDKSVTAARKYFLVTRKADSAQVRTALTSVIEHIGANTYQVGTPTGSSYQLTVPIRNVTDGGARLSASYKLDLAVGQKSGKWYVGSFLPNEWDASGSGGKNPPFHCTPGFIVTFRGSPLAGLLAPFPFPDLAPEPTSVTGADNARDIRGFGASVIFDHRSTGLPAGPSRSMYDCYVKYVVRHGWKHDRYADKSQERVSGKGVFAHFYVSRSSTKALSIEFGKDEFSPGKYELTLFVSLKGYLPPPP